MLFTSIPFLVFLPLVFLAYYICPLKWRWVVLLCSSYIFYAYAGVQYVLVLVYVTLSAYFFARMMEKSSGVSGKMMPVCVVAIILPLLFFKYTGFLVSNINIILRAMQSATSLSTMEIALPLGISFYTFSALGYVIDVSRGEYPAIKNPFHLAAGLSFFPCLVSGPIERQNKLIPQILKGNVFDYSLASYGLKQIAWGLFEKMVIADNLAAYVDRIFPNMRTLSSASLLTGSLFYTIQIYCDFAGYSDIALGVAKLFGIQLTKNFNSPYLSTSLQEFWRRWHISLSSWLRDYVYIPLGGNRKGIVRKRINIILTMLVSGIWHGAAWTFVFWGGAHGCAQVAESVFGLDKREKQGWLVSIIKMVLVFSICSVLWIFFRADSFSDAGYMITHMFAGITNLKEYVFGITELEIGRAVIMVFAACIITLAVYDYFSLKTDVISVISSLPLVARWSIYILFLLIVAQFSYKGANVKFVYAGF